MFIDRPIGGVYPVLWYDDHTGTNTCGDNEAMFWAGLATRDGNELSGAFGKNFCVDTGDGDGAHEGNLGDRFNFSLTYDPDTDTVVAGAFAGGCVGTAQPRIRTVRRAVRALERGNYSPSGPEHNVGCEG